jgi:hypothetical protein
MSDILRELDRALSRGEVEEVVASISRIRLICDDIENSIQDEIDYVSRRNEELRNRYTHEYINDVEFMVKPVTVANIYEGDYLDHFVGTRARQLKDSGAEIAHNTFWTEYLTLHGNVFGSVPVELIGPDAAMALEKFGWKPVVARIYDFGQALEVSMAFYEFCDEKFGKYIVVQEAKTKAYMVLSFEV